MSKPGDKMIAKLEGMADDIKERGFSLNKELDFIADVSYVLLGEEENQKLMARFDDNQKGLVSYIMELANLIRELQGTLPENRQ